MIVHSSAILAILRGEPEGDAMLAALLDAPRARMAATDWLACAMFVEDRGGRLAALKFDAFFAETGIELATLTPEHGEAARAAWRHFGRHFRAAGLEWADCLAYALAKTSGERLLHAEPGFARTDIEAAHGAAA